MDSSKIPCLCTVKTRALIAWELPEGAADHLGRLKTRRPRLPFGRGPQLYADDQIGRKEEALTFVSGELDAVCDLHPGEPCNFERLSPDANKRAHFELFRNQIRRTFPTDTFDRL
jgi:hypothetical protein